MRRRSAGSSPRRIGHAAGNGPTLWPVSSLIATPVSTAPVTHGVMAKVGGYVALTKPRIIELLLVSTVPTMIVAERGIPSLWLMFATVVGGTTQFDFAAANPGTYRVAVTVSAGGRETTGTARVTLLPPEQSAKIGDDLRFFVPPGSYDLVCEVAVPGFTATRGDGRQIVPGAGEWTGTLTTREASINILAPDAPARESGALDAALRLGCARCRMSEASRLNAPTRTSIESLDSP